MKPDRSCVYKQVGDVGLTLDVFLPQHHRREDRRAAIVFFFGGGWVNGTPTQFYPQCRHYADLGLVAMTPEYRTWSGHRVPPFDCVRDAKAAVRWVRQHAAELGIDPNRVIVGGGSAGGNLAAACALVRDYDDEGGDAAVSPVPDALVLFNPVIDNGPGGYGHDRIGDAYPAFSPLHNIAPGAPPTLIMIGTEDHLIPVATVEEYQRRMRAVGAECEVRCYEGQGHGFFNPEEYRLITLRDVDDFLSRHGYLPAGA